MEAPERYIYKLMTDKIGRTQRRKMINPEYVKWSLALENCILITEPKRMYDWFDYSYNDKIYHMKFVYWEDRYRPHLNQLSDGMYVHDDILNNPYAYTKQKAPEWYKKKFSNNESL